jgi:hypothetical protein
MMVNLKQIHAMLLAIQEKPFLLHKLVVLLMN